ncbi:MAG: glycosyltransferase family 39 protein [Terriglobales bacterium]
MQNSTPPAVGPRAKFAACLNSKWCMVLVALAIRLAVAGFLYPDQMDPSRNHWHFAFENGKIAYSIVQGHGFGSPLFENTGPTAWMTPVYPYLIAGVFVIFGTYGKASALVLLSLQALISALTCMPVFFVARKTFGERVALFSGWAWALFPLGIYWPAERIWPTWLATLLLTILFLMTLHFERPAGWRAWIGYGLLWGFTALTEPICLTVLPTMLGWVGFRLYQQKERWFMPLTVASLTIILSVSPWFIRNYEVFHRFIPFRDGMGLELLIGNNGDTSYWAGASLGSALKEKIGPWHNDAEWQRFKQIGELAYMAECQQKAFAFIRANPRWFAIVTVRRFVFVWTHFWSFSHYYLQQEPDDPINVVFSTIFTLLTLIGLRRAYRVNKPVAALYALVFLFFPGVFYFTHVEVYFRRQIDPLMLVLAVYGVMGFMPTLRSLKVGDFHGRFRLGTR